MAKLSQRVEKEFAWQQLRDQICAGESGLKIEDEIKGVELKDGQKITFQVVYVSPDGTEVKFVSKNCLKDEYPMNERRTNEGGFIASDLFQRLQTEIFKLLPDDLAAVVSEVKKNRLLTEKKMNTAVNCGFRQKWNYSAKIISEQRQKEKNS